MLYLTFESICMMWRENHYTMVGQNDNVGYRVLL